MVPGKASSVFSTVPKNTAGLEAQASLADGQAAQVQPHPDIAPRKTNKPKFFTPSILPT